MEHHQESIPPQTVGDGHGQGAGEALIPEGIIQAALQIVIMKLFVQAARKGQLSSMQAMMRDQRLNINGKDMQSGLNALHSAIVMGHRHVLSWLLEQGVDIEAKDAVIMI